MVRVQHLWTDIATTSVSLPVPEDTTFGLKFEPHEVFVVTAVRWRRVGIGHEEQPLKLGIWNLGTETLLAETTDVRDDFSPGWQVAPLDTPIEIGTGNFYAITGLWPANATINPPFDTAWPSPNILTLTVPLHPGLTGGSDWSGPPGIELPEVIPPLDLDAQIAPVDLAPVTKQDLYTALDEWLGLWSARQPITTIGTIPALLLNIQRTGGYIADVVDGISSGISSGSDAVVTYLETNLGTTAEWAASAHPKLVTWLAALLAVLADALTTLAFLHDLFPAGHTPSDHDASLEAHRAATEPDGETLPAYIEGEIEIVLSAVTDQTNEITQILAHGNGTEDVATIVGESDWGNIFRFDVPADFYVVDIATTDVEAVVEDVAGTSVWDHLGFCIPLTVDGLPEYGPRLAIGGQVIRTGRQMGGIILNGRRVLSGHVTAYKYQPA